MAGALIVTAELAGEDFAWLDRLRRAHFPPERNHLRAHLTIFHALPPSAEAEARRALSLEASEAPPQASLEGLMNLGSGVAYRVVSPELEQIRSRLAAQFQGLLTAQDSAGWRPHVTVQNKVRSSAARALQSTLESDFRPRPLGIASLGLHRYLDGPWEQVALFPFRGR